MLREVTRKECLKKLSEGKEVLFVDRENNRFVDLNEIISGLLLADMEEPETPKEPPKEYDWGKVYALRKAGWSAPKISDEMGIGVQTIYNRFRTKGDPKYPDEIPGKARD